jgi:hypothetical protein
MPSTSTTPILDLEKELPKPPRRSWLRRIAGYTAFVLTIMALDIGFRLASDLGRFDSLHLPELPSLNGWLLLPALYVAILIHELGHLAAGVMVGMNPGGICVGGLMLAKSGDRWIFRFESRFLFGGFAIPLPAQREFRRARHAWMTAGGPLASILLTILCGLAIRVFGNGVWDWIATLFWSGVITVVPSVIPYSVKGHLSDEARLWQLLRNPDRARRWMAVVALQAENMNGVRPRDWSAEVMEQALESADSEPYYAAVQLLAASRSMDQGDQDSALQHLENALAAPSGNTQKSVLHACYLEASAMSAKERRNAAQARVWMDRAAALKAPSRPAQTAGVKARLAMAEGRFAEALDHWARFRDLIQKKLFDSGTARFAKDNIAEAESECRAALANQDLSRSTATP